ncbi:FtsX-like permease family protein [Gorillibacterium sp. CAU 1737]|uniref:ABC transporter permease n=1 Tax=Gorillibacterium sp. CAU 1737 TaxID=3140362 RepID=UPI0032618AB1
MRLITYSLRNIRHRLFLSLLTVIAIAATVAFIVLFSLFRTGVEHGAEQGYGPFDLVIGAAGSESQLVLNTFYHIGAPTGNIPLSVLDRVHRDPGVAEAFAFTTGDRMSGYPIVGIEPRYFPTRYGDRSLSSGRLYAATGEAVLGSEAARTSGLSVGDTFTGAHGLVGEVGHEEENHAGEEHHEGDATHEEGSEQDTDEHARFHYTVTGILPPLHTPDDRAVFTTVDSAWAVHGHSESAEEKEITAILVKPASLLGVHTLKQGIGSSLPGVQAVYSSKVVADLMNTVDQGSRLVGMITALCVLLAALTILLSLVAAAGERTKDAGLLRLLGKPKSFVWLTIMSEGLILSFIGLATGLLLGHFAAWLARGTAFARTGVQLQPFSWTPEQGLLIAGTLGIGLIASLLPAFRLYRQHPLALVSRSNLLILTLGLALPLLLTGCGQKEPAAAAVGSFNQAVAAPAERALDSPAAVSPSPSGTQSATAAVSAPAVSSEPAPTDGGASGATDRSPAPASSDPAAQTPAEPSSSAASAVLPPPSASASSDPAAQEGSGKTNPSTENKPSASPSTAKEPGSSSTGTDPARTSANPSTAPSAPAASPKASKKPTQGTMAIGWNDFFDGTDQTRPSERFWDLSDDKATVTIKGFMGEVLSFEKHWFLLIPAPGAECPFDNGDETYWNKIMIVFVEGDQKLRYKSGPLEITGRLDVGIKVDESGYKTMFRIYDASFKELSGT